MTDTPTVQVSTDPLKHSKCGKFWRDHKYEKLEYETRVICPETEREAYRLDERGEVL